MPAQQQPSTQQPNVQPTSGSSFLANRSTSNSMIVCGAPSLEDMLVQQHGIRYSEAKKLILLQRQELRMSRIAPWNHKLLEACERTLLGVKGLTTGSGVDAKQQEAQKQALPAVKQIVDVDARKPAQKKDAAPEEETESTLQESFVSLATAVSQAILASPQPQDPRPLTPTPEQTTPEQATPEEANTEQKDEEEVQPISDEESCYTDEEDCDDDDEEYDDDEGSQDSDNSKCYTTAEEVGIDEAVLERMAKEAMEEDEKEGGRDDKQESESEKEVAEKEVAEADNPACSSPVSAPTKTPPSRRKHKIPPSKQLSQRRNMMSSDITVDTTDTGIPNVIYIRHTSRPEIPDDEPLGECFNIPTPLRAKDMRKARRQRIQQKFVCRLRRWGIVRGKETLDAEDFECHVQTLIDL